jgi:uncharacterized protein YcbX
MLLQKTPEGYKNMAVCYYPVMTRFLTSITLPEDDPNGNGFITVKFSSTDNEKAKTLTIPLRPNTDKLEAFKVDMHNSPTNAFKMPEEYSAWFSGCFGFDVLLVYLGDGLRDVLFEDMKPTKSGSWLSKTPFLGSPDLESHQITFADCAPYLIVSKTSLNEVSSRLPDGQEMDVTKFRPNIIIEGADKCWEEDHWGKVRINGVEMSLPHNCVRCKSINIDYSTGKPGTGESGEVLKKLQKDRRVDMGAKWSPVFGRYSFWNSKQNTQIFRIGDEATITKVNKEKTVWGKIILTTILLTGLLTSSSLERTGLKRWS